MVSQMEQMHSELLHLDPLIMCYPGLTYFPHPPDLVFKDSCQKGGSNELLMFGPSSADLNICQVKQVGGDSFQCSENPECSQRRYIPQVHKLCYISEIREDHTQTPMTTTNTPRTPPRQRTTRRYVTHRACPLRGGKEGKENQNTHTYT